MFVESMDIKRLGDSEKRLYYDLRVMSDELRILRLSDGRAKLVSAIVNYAIVLNDQKTDIPVR